jgi:hypothetical protein
MPGFLMHVGAIAACPHQGRVTTTPTQTKVLVSGQPVATSTNRYMVGACVFTVPGPKPQPCVTTQWLPSSFAGRVRVLGQPVLLQATVGTGQGLCFSAEQAPQGPPSVTAVQTRVRGI